MQYITGNCSIGSGSLLVASVFVLMFCVRVLKINFVTFSTFIYILRYSQVIIVPTHLQQEMYKTQTALRLSRHNDFLVHLIYLFFYNYHWSVFFLHAHTETWTNVLFIAIHSEYNLICVLYYIVSYHIVFYFMNSLGSSFRCWHYSWSVIFLLPPH